MKMKSPLFVLTALVLMFFTQSCLKDAAVNLEEASVKNRAVVNCDLPEACTGGIELLELFPEVDNYFFDLHIYRTDQSVSVNSVTEFNNLSDDQKCHVISYSDYSSAVGFNKPYIQIGYIANLPYYENERYWFIGGLLPNGGQMPTANDYIRIKLYHPSSGNDCMDIYDGIVTNTISFWDTGDCEGLTQTNNCRHRK